jgi:tRNA nucleotidyltransferase (CCA-adding enzyme)
MLRPDAIPSHIAGVCRKLRAAGFEAWLVGGAVRDLLLGREAHDFDVATSAHPPEVMEVFGRRHVIPTGEKHGTVTVLVSRDKGDREHVEVTTFRGEGAYSDGRRPDSVSFVSSLVEDLRRRDFTMNAVAYDPLVDRVEDPFAGQKDLEARLIRAVGDPLERFREDGLRTMRAVRFAAQLGFALDPATEAAIPQTLEVFKKVSAERVRDELVKILSSKKPSVGLELMRTTGLLAATVPELMEGVGFNQNRFHSYDVWHHTLAAVDNTPLGSATGPPWIVRFAALFHDVAKPRTAAPKADAPGEHTFFRHEHLGAKMTDEIARRLKLSTQEREHAVNLVGNHMFWYSAEWSDGTAPRSTSSSGASVSNYAPRPPSRSPTSRSAAPT